MNIKIKNLGAVHEADINLKPLSIFVGQNNTGKTWSAYALAEIFGDIGRDEYINAYKMGKLNDSYPPIDNALEQLNSEGNAKIDLIEFANKYYTYYINNVARLAPHWIKDAMGTQLASFKNLEITLELLDIPKFLLDRILRSEINGKLSVSKDGDALYNGTKRQKDSIIYYYTKGHIDNKLPETAIREFISSGVFSAIHGAMYGGAYFFPSDRAAFIAIFIEPNATIEENDSIVEEIPRSQDRNQVRAPSYPIADFIGTIMEAQRKGSQIKRLDEAKKSKRVALYIELAKLLQIGILGGNLYFSTPEPDVARDLLFQPSMNEEAILDMPVVSSMVKGLSSLALYLYYFAEPRDLIVIDEPEMNLHPEAQGKIIEFLAMLVNAGLHVIITTHSPFILDHLVNLIKASKNENKDAIKDKFYLKSTEAFIDQENVSVYLFEDNTAKNILDDEGFINWKTFSKESERISQLYFEI